MFSDKQLKDMILPLLMEYPDLSDNTTAHKKFFAVSRQTGQMILYLVLIHNIANAVVFHLRILWEKASGQQVMPCLPWESLWLRPLV